MGGRRTRRVTAGGGVRSFGELEAAIMDRVWAAGRPVLVREIWAHLRPEREPAYNTVLTVVEILYRKGWLARDKDGRAYRYRATLARARWPEGAPRLAIAAWFALTGSAVASVLAGGLALMVPTVRVSADLAGLLAACVMALRAQYAHPGGAALTGAGAVLALAVLARITWCTARALAQAGQARRRHRLRLLLVGTADSQLGAVVVRHHLPVTLAGALNAAFPRVPAFRIACQQVTRLAELSADDAASAAAHRLSVAGALLSLGAGVPAAALGATGTADAARVRRLIDGPAAIGRTRAAAVASAVAAVVLVPLLLLAGPAASARGMNYCPHGPAVAAPAAAVALPRG